MFFLGLIMAAFAYIFVAYIKKLKPFEPKSGDVCNPKSSEQVDHGVTYTIRDDKCRVKTCLSGYTKSGNSCIDDLESDYIGVVGVFAGTENTAPVGYKNSDIDEQLIIPFQPDDAQQNINVVGGALASPETGKLSNLCKRSCVRTEDCTGIFLFEDKCMMLNTDFDYENDIDYDSLNTKILQKK